MADDVNSTADRESHLTELRIKMIRAHQRELQPKGSCYWCAETFTPGDPRLFCDDECAVDFERDKRNGR